MNGELIDVWWLGATRVAHRMLDLGEDFPIQYRSRCGLFWAKAPRPAAEEVRRCGQCVRALAADARHTVAHGAAAGPSLRVVYPECPTGVACTGCRFCETAKLAAEATL